jgi:hypothetical protein
MQIVDSISVIYEKMQTQFRLTPNRPHYNFTFMHISRVYQGILKVRIKVKVYMPSIENRQNLVNLWVHEFMRVFTDGMGSLEEQDELIKILTFEFRKISRIDL